MGTKTKIWRDGKPRLHPNKTSDRVGYSKVKDSTFLYTRESRASGLRAYHEYHSRDNQESRRRAAVDAEFMRKVVRDEKRQKRGY